MVASAASPVSGKPGRTLPAAAGIGLRTPHHVQVLAEKPEVGWLEVHSENFFAQGGARIAYLETVREHYLLSLHGVGLSLGSVDALDRRHLASLKESVRRFEPTLVSEHLSWSSVGGQFAHDLLPLPYTEEALRHIAARIGAVQSELGRQILIENVSSYVQFDCSNLSEWDFLVGVAAESGCGILLDLNNVFVAASNHGFDADDYLRGIPAGEVQEIHLAGHGIADLGDERVLIDTHSDFICPEVWSLYCRALQRFGPVPTLIEWDAQIPALDVLVGEAHKADALRRAQHAHAA